MPALPCPFGVHGVGDGQSPAGVIESRLDTVEREPTFARIGVETRLAAVERELTFATRVVDQLVRRIEALEAQVNVLKTRLEGDRREEFAGKKRLNAAWDYREYREDSQARK